MTDDEILEQAEAIKQRRIEEYRAQAQTTENRIKEGSPFKDEELRYAATSRCVCGAGLAYPLNIGMRGSWFCADWLTARNNARTSGKHDEYPFMFYEIKSEDQPSAYGMSTRPKAAV